MIKCKAVALLASIVFLTAGFAAYADVDVLMQPHQDMQLVHPKKEAFKLEDALSRLDYVSPQIQAAKQRVERYILESKLKPNEVGTPLTYNITPFEVPAFMLLEEIRKFTFGRHESLVMKTVGEAKARLELDNYNIVCLEAKNDLKKLYVASVLNDSYIEVLEDNLSFFESAYKDAEKLENQRLILPSDLLKIRNHNEEIKNELESRKLKQKVYKENIGQLIDEKKITLTPEGAIKSDLYNFDQNKIGKYMKDHPEIQKNTDLFAVLRSERVYKKITDKRSIEDYLSITIRRVVFEGPFILIKRPAPTTFISLFQDPNKKVKKQLFENQIKIAEFELKASMQDFIIKAKTQHYKMLDSYKELQESKNNLDYHKRAFFERQRLYKVDLVKITKLVDAKAALYKAELDYLEKLESYNNSISDLQYYVGQYQES